MRWRRCGSALHIFDAQNKRDSLIVFLMFAGMNHSFCCCCSFSKIACFSLMMRLCRKVPRATFASTIRKISDKRLSGPDVNKLSFVEAVNRAPQTWQNPMEHQGWDKKDVDTIAITHKPAEGIADTIAYGTVQLMRFSYDLFAGFKFGHITERKYLSRCVFLETVAGVPGMVGALVRHLRSLRSMKRDHGWIHTLLEEAENERMHLLTFIELRKPGILFRGTVLATQAVFFNAFLLIYVLAPRFAHRLVGYIEEEAVKTYTHILEDTDAGKLPEFKKIACPPLARSYWHLPKDANFRDLIAAIRADEAGHRLVNHTFADMHAKKMQNETNPFIIYDAKEKQ